MSPSEPALEVRSGVELGEAAALEADAKLGFSKRAGFSTHVTMNLDQIGGRRAG